MTGEVCYCSHALFQYLHVDFSWSSSSTWFCVFKVRVTLSYSYISFLQDILTILCLKGPFTEGIFRKAANEKARKELKEELNSGGMVDLKSLPVHLLAVVFKVRSQHCCQ